MISESSKVYYTEVIETVLSLDLGLRSNQSQISNSMFENFILWHERGHVEEARSIKN